MRTRRITLAAMLLLTACTSNGSVTGDEAQPAGSPSVTAEARTVIIEGDEGPVLLNVEVADEAEERRRGLMGRSSLEENSGMVFVFFEPTTAGFWMKNTNIPLSIAFFDRKGEIVRILDMDPCTQDPCPVYEPGVTYRGALEVNQGFFDDHGIAEGDVIRLTP
jgi:uncharacterized protein